MNSAEIAQPESYIFMNHLENALGLQEGGLKKICEISAIIPTQRRAGSYLPSSQVRHLLLKQGYRYPARARRISMMMCKGGVGKTTSSLFLSQRLASYGARVLAIDSDPQGNLSAALRPGDYGYTITEKTPVLVDVMTGTCKITDAILPLTSQLHLLPSSAINSLLERKLQSLGGNPVIRLDKIISTIENRYDYIVIDSAPTLNLINAGIIYASSLVILPTQLDEFARLGLKQTVTEIQDLQREFNFNTHARILLNRFNPREKLSFLYLGYLADQFKPLMLKTAIRSCSEVRAAIIAKKDLFGRAKSKAAEDFDALAREIMEIPLLQEADNATRV